MLALVECVEHVQNCPINGKPKKTPVNAADPQWIARTIKSRIAAKLSLSKAFIETIFSLNATATISETLRTEKRVAVRISANGDRMVKIAVSDNGIGIAPENLSRIFAHGFTTKVNGHGFGLHSAALAATETGGSLSAHSDGPDRGATFILELPMDDQLNGNSPLSPATS